MYLECGAQEVAIRFLHAKFKFSNVIFETAAQRDRCDLLRMPKSAVGHSRRRAGRLL